jgi:serine/threonine protein kinase
VGHLCYSSPESRCGLAGHRKLAKFTDIYALGCILFELFNKELFFVEQRKDTNFEPVLAAIAIDVIQGGDLDQKVTAWCEGAKRFKRAITLPRIDGNGSSTPRSIASLLNGLLQSLVSFDYRDRIFDFELARRKIQSAIRMLRNKAAREVAIKRESLYRERRTEKLLRKQQRLIESKRNHVNRNLVS